MNKIQFFAAISILAMTIASCNNNETGQSKTSEVVELQADLLGNYNGSQPGYFMKNRFGDDMIVDGNKLPIPPSDWKFILQEKNAVSLQQSYPDDGSRYYLDGTYQIINDSDERVVIECSLSDGKTSNPTYTLTIDKANQSAICTGRQQPEVTLVKVK